MINARLMVLGATIFLTMSACSQGEDVTEVAVVDTGNTLFAYVPASSPYVLGNLEPPTDEVIDTYLRRIQPVLDTMQEELSQGKQAIEAKQNEGSSSSPGQQHDDASIKLMHAVLVELDGKLNRPGLESLGFDLQSHKVVYGMGAFPVVRLGLSDAGALRGTIQRILDNAGISAPEKTYQSVSYWRLGEEGDDVHQEVDSGEESRPGPRVIEGPGDDVRLLEVHGDGGEGEEEHEDDDPHQVGGCQGPLHSGQDPTAHGQVVVI